MSNNEISTILDSLYARANTGKFAIVFASLYLPFFLHVNMGVGWFYVVSIFTVCLAVAVIYFYQLFILKKAIAVRDDFAALDKQVRLFKRWNNIGWYMCPLFMAFLIWLCCADIEKPDNIGFVVSMLLGALIGGIIGIFKQRKINQDLRRLSDAIAQ